MTQVPGTQASRPPVRATRAMVAAPHTLASSAGIDAMRRGGSAVDAAIAVNAVLCVAYPHMAGLGGDGFWMIADPDGTIIGINASGPAAQLATRDSYRERGHTEAIPPRGALSALTVPGAVDGWRLAHERYGRLAWAELFGDAIHLARHGVPVSRSLADWLAIDRDILAAHDATAAVFLPGGREPTEGARIVQADLAGSLEEVARRGARAGFYEGPLAERLCGALAADGSPLRRDDLAGFRAHWEQPIAATYRDLTVHELPPNTQGLAALQILRLIDGFDVAGWGDGTPDYYHHLAEAVKLAFADRDEWLTDGRWVDIPVGELLADAYLADRRRLIDPRRAMAMEEVQPGLRFGTARRTMPVGGDTCAFSAVDPDGLAVSAIQSIYHDFGSGRICGDTGIVAQNRGASFSLADDHPNALEPGKRTSHTLIPAIATRDGRSWLVFGTMGGEGQPQTHAALLTRIVDFGYDVQQAIDAPRWRVGRTWGTAAPELALEGRVPTAVARELRHRGHPVTMVTDWDHGMGHAQAIRVGPQRGSLEGGADPRADGAAIGF